MTIAEADAIIDSVLDNDKASWEKIRWLGYITCLTHGATFKSPMDLMKFSWEETENATSLTKDTRTPEEVRQSLLEIKNSLL